MSDYQSILITGVSVGIGAGLADFYLEAGAKVYGLNRTAPKWASHENFLSVDFSALDDFTNKVTPFLRGKQFDLVVLNAGVLPPVGDIQKTELADIKRVMDINVWSNKLLLDVLLNENKPKQVVGMSSGASISKRRGWNAYSLSKSSLNMLLKTYSAEATETHFTSLAPGLIETAMQDYISSLNQDDRYPIIETLQSARGTERMPSPDKAAAMLNKAFKASLKYESGSFIDVREMDL